jgi:hypothetical protein
MGKQNDQIAKMFHAGVPVDTIREQFGVTRKKIGLIVNSGEAPEVNNDKIVKAYNSGAPLDRLGVMFCVDSSVIRRVLTNAGVEINGWGEHTRVYDINHEFFSKIDTEEKAYWLGFIYADGNVPQGVGSFSITLKDSDRMHLEKLKAALEYTGPIKTIERSTIDKDFKYSKLEVFSNALATDLFSKGVVPAKSMIVAPPAGIPKALERHFIRGMWDGDGTISPPNSRGVCVALCSGSNQLLDWVLHRMPAVSRDIKIRPTKTIWEIRVTSKADGHKWLTFLYEDANVFLDRKMARATADLLKWRDNV